MDINKYNTKVRQEMSDKYVDCSKKLSKLRREVDDISKKLNDGRDYIPYNEYTRLENLLKDLMNRISTLIIEQNIWDQAREICLNTSDEMCPKDTYNSDTLEIKATVWYAGDDVFIESRYVYENKTEKYLEQTLKDILEEAGVKENSKVDVTITTNK